MTHSAINYLQKLDLLLRILLTVSLCSDLKRLSAVFLAASLKLSSRSLANQREPSPGVSRTSVIPSPLDLPKPSKKSKSKIKTTIRLLATLKKRLMELRTNKPPKS